LEKGPAIWWGLFYGHKTGRLLSHPLLAKRDEYTNHPFWSRVGRDYPAVLYLGRVFPVDTCGLGRNRPPYSRRTPRFLGDGDPLGLCRAKTSADPT